MDCKRILTLAVLLLAAACSQRYELNIPLALNRTEMRFPSSGNSYYVLVYSNGPWTAALEKETSWVSLSRTEGSGNGLIMVSADVNRGVSRGVSLFVRNAAGVREMYISQEKSGTDVGNYVFLKEKAEMLRSAATGRMMVRTDLDDETLSRVKDTVVYAFGENWIHDIRVSASRVTFRIDENNSGVDREATVRLSFPLARWDTPLSTFFTVSQSTAEPVTMTANLSPIGGQGLSWEEGDRLVLLEEGGTKTAVAEVSASEGSAATLLYNGDELQSGILGAVYPENYVSRWTEGKVYISLPEIQPYVSSPLKAADLCLLCGKKEGQSLNLNAACSLLSLELQGSGTLRQLSLVASVPLAGEGTIDMSGANPAFVPSADASSEISVELPVAGVTLPARLCVTVPAGDLGEMLVNATTSAWSGSVSGRATQAGKVGEIVPFSELSLTLPSEAEDLTGGGKWANCFLVENTDGAMYSVDIRRRDGSVPADDISRCTILWQTVPGLVDYLAVDSSRGKLFFHKAASQSGNALLAVMNESGLIRWSYHIWAPSEPVQTRKIGSYLFMDRNIGAVRAAASDHSNASIGMHYQWGRKDPFPPATGTKTSGNGMRSKVYPDNIFFVTAQNGVTQAEADATPNTYYWGSGASGKEDWRSEQDDALWASGDSPANPCPYGWTVPSNEALEPIPARLKEAEYVAQVGITIRDDDGKEMLFVPGGSYRRSVSTASELANMSDGRIWSSTPCGLRDAYRGSYYLWYQSNVNNRRLDNANPQRRWGGNVRCVKMQ